MLFRCCRSNDAVDGGAHRRGENGNQEGGEFDDDLKAVRWMRDRGLERNLKGVKRNRGGNVKKIAAQDGEDNATQQTFTKDSEACQTADNDSILKDPEQDSLREEDGKINKRRKRDRRHRFHKIKKSNEEEEQTCEPEQLQEPLEKSNRGSFDIAEPTLLQVETGNDVDSLTQKRYGMAVQLLHRRLIQKGKSLTPSEKQLLNDIIQSDQEDDENDTEDETSAIESTIECLDDTSSLLPESPFSHRPVSESNISVFSVTSEGVGIETSLHGTRKEIEEQSNEKDKTSQIVKRDDIIEDEEMNDSPYPVLGLSSDIKRPLLKVRLMEALRGFLPYAVSEENFWLKYSSCRDGNSLLRFKQSVQASQYTLLIIQATDEEDCVFGAFTSTPWRHHNKWFGSGQSFLFKRTDTLEVYPYTGDDDLVQYCTSEMMAVGGGDWSNVSSPYSKGEKSGIGLSIDKDLTGGETYSCATFCNPRLCSKPKNEYTIEKIEIWALTPCMTEAEAAKLEKHKLFVERHRQKSTN